MKPKRDQDNARQVVKDRLSSLPDEIIHRILFLSNLDMKFVVQTCLLSTRWETLWKSMPYLNFSSSHFRGDVSTFTNFVTHVLSHRNHQVQVSSVNLCFHTNADKDFVRKIASYAFSHNVQALTVDNWPLFPSCEFSSQSIKHFTCSSYDTFTFIPSTTQTPLDFPSLTTLYLSGISFSGDFFSKCVSLKNLTLKICCAVGDAFDIITPQLSSLTLTNGSYLNVKIIAPQLENLTITNCLIKFLNAPPGLRSLCYTDDYFPPLFKNGFHSLNKATIYLSTNPIVLSKNYASKIINMLQMLYSARYLTLDADIVECISSYPDLLSQHCSPFRNLVCLAINPSMKRISFKVNISNEVKKFLLDNSPSATFVINGWATVVVNK